MTVLVGTVALNIIYEKRLLMVLSTMMKQKLPPKNIPNLGLKCPKINNLFMNKTADKRYPLGSHTHVAYLRENPPFLGIIKDSN